VAAAVACLEPTVDEKEAVNHLVQKRRDEQPTVVLGVLEDGRREHDERLIATEAGAPA